jgi:uroporphyrinogen decarboxylase
MSASKRDTVLALLGSEGPQTVPAAFFLHFDPMYHTGKAAVQKHLEYARATGMDIIKIQYEHRMPPVQDLKRPEDWSRIPRLDPGFFSEPLGVVAGLVAEAKRDALVVLTLYSPFMFAGHIAGPDTVVAHLQQDPERVTEGLRIVTDNVITLVRGAVAAGVDGFYASTQGGEVDRFEAPGIFERYIKPFDLAVWQVIRETCPFNILHVCDYHGVYAGLEPYLDYPGQLVSAGLRLRDGQISAADVTRLFGRPFLGGMDRHGVIATGTPDAIRMEVRSVIEHAPERFMLGADCTVPSNVPWENLKAAIDTAHDHRRP